MLCKKKGPSSSFSSLFFSSSPTSSFCTPLSPLSPPRQPFACPPITHRYTRHTVRSHHRHYFDCHLSPPPPVCGGPLEWSFSWHSHRVHFPPLLFLNVQCCLFVFFNMWGRGAILMILVVLLFFLFQSWEGRCVKTTYPHLGALKHTTRRPVHRPSLSVSHTPPLPSLLPRLSPFVCTV